MEMARRIMVGLSRFLPAGRARDEGGFSLIEVLVAMMILTAGLLPLAALFAVAVQRMGGSTPNMMAREKAREAIESVHAARDTGTASWATIRNEADGGVFLDGAQAIKAPGDDGLVNTEDDGAEEFPVEAFSREIVISPLNIDGTETEDPNLREVRVIVRYRVNNAWQTYTVVTYISSYS
jgi:prepilin-type N-terminal cleavage/methylation domain-containing protein